jgi:hypothetical protein
VRDLSEALCGAFRRGTEALEAGACAGVDQMPTRAELDAVRHAVSRLPTREELDDLRARLDSVAAGSTSENDEIRRRLDDLESWRDEEDEGEGEDDDGDGDDAPVATRSLRHQPKAAPDPAAKPRRSK